MKARLLSLILALALAGGGRLDAQLSLFSRIRKLPSNRLYPMATSSISKQRKQGQKINTQWLAFSDREKNVTFADPYGREKLTKLNFLQPLLVVKSRHGYCKVVAYDRGILAGPGLVEALFGIPMKKYRIAERKKVKYLGWVPEAQLLHSPNSLVDSCNLRPLQYYATVNATALVNHRSQFLEKDSVLMTHFPGYRKQIAEKALVNDWFYVYKKLDRPRQYLIGTEPWIDPDSARGSFGWVSAEVLLPRPQNMMLLPFTSTATDSAVGARVPPVGWKVPKLRRQALEKNIIDLSKHPFPLRNEWMLPVYIPVAHRFDSVTRRLPTYVPDDLIDIQESRVYNCIGYPISYPSYEALQQQMKNINIVVVFEDGKEGKESLRNMISSFQDLSQTVQSENFEKFRFHYAAIGYMDRWISDSLSWTPSFSNWLKFIQKKAEDNSMEYASNEHVMLRGIHDAAKLLQGKEREHNIVLVIGSKINPKVFPRLFDRVADKLSKASANVLFLQTTAGRSQSYSDYVLQAKRILDEVGVQSRGFRQQIIVDNRLVKYRNDLKYMNECGNGFLYDFPAKSMQKGGLFFPSNTGVLCPNLLKSVLDTLLEQVRIDHQLVLTGLRDKFANLRRTKQNVNPRLKMILEEQGLVGLPDQYANAYDDRFFVEAEVNFDPSRPYFKPCYLVREDAFATLVQQLRRIVIDPRVDGNGDSQINFMDRRRWSGELRHTYLDRNRFYGAKGAVSGVPLARVIFMETGFPVNNDYFQQVTIRSVARKAEQEELLPAILRFYRSILRMEAYTSEHPEAVVQRGTHQYYLIPMEILP